MCMKIRQFTVPFPSESFYFTWIIWKTLLRCRTITKRGLRILNLKDAYCHIQIAPHHRHFLRFAFEGVAYQFSDLHFGLSIAPRTFTKCMNAVFSHSIEGNMNSELPRQLVNYGHLREQALCPQEFSHQPPPASGAHNQYTKKIYLQPMQNMPFLDMNLDSISMGAHLLPEGSRAIMNLLAAFKEGQLHPLKCFQRTLGLTAAGYAVCCLGLLQMQLFQLWMKMCVPVSAWLVDLIITDIINVQMLAPWMNSALYEQGVPLGQIC